MRTVAPFEDTTIGNGKYFIKKGQTIVINAYHAHKDPAVYGDDVRLSLLNCTMRLRSLRYWCEL